jgi:integrase/recombinase XerD
MRRTSADEKATPPRQTTKPEALHSHPPFGSRFGPVMRGYVALMQAMGYCYETEEQRLLLLDRFLQNRPDLSGAPVTEVIREWTNTGTSAHHALVCHVTGRLLVRALSRIDPTVERIPADRRVYLQARQQYRQPYIFTDHEFLRLAEAALRFPSPQSPLRPQTLHMMLVLAYCVGLRIGELLRLSIGDFDADNRTIEIRCTKFFKSRRLPLANSVVAALHSYFAARRQAGAPNNADSALLWHRQAAGRYSREMAESLLIGVLRRTGLKPEAGRIGPHVHDFRHSFVVNRMLAWYRQGVNPQSHLPYLATYLGHKDINSTLVYLTITQELLQQASDRFRVRGVQILAASTGGKR